MTATPPPAPDGSLVPVGGAGFDLQASIFNQLIQAQAEVIVPGRGTDRLHLGMTEAAVREILGEPEEVSSLDDLLDDDDEFFGTDHAYRKQGVVVNYRAGVVTGLSFLSGLPSWPDGPPCNPYPGVIQPSIPLTCGRDDLVAVFGEPRVVPGLEKHRRDSLGYDGVQFMLERGTGRLTYVLIWELP